MRSTLATRNSRIAIAVALAVMLGACAHHETHPSQAPMTTTTRAAPKPVHVARPKPTPVAKSTVAPTAGPTAAPEVSTPATTEPHLNMLAAPTGIAECDDYLGNYKACHIVLGTQFTDIDMQLAKLRTNILDTVRDQGTEAARAKCVALVKQRNEALQGRSCN